MSAAALCMHHEPQANALLFIKIIKLYYNHDKVYMQVANVYRNGKERSIKAGELVVGDFVHLTNGTRVSADIKVTCSKDLKLDFSSITGAVQVSVSHHATDENG